MMRGDYRFPQYRWRNGERAGYVVAGHGGYVAVRADGEASGPWQTVAMAWAEVYR